ncbi:hypothetical protein HDZ31DRAFT_77269, partial [Schizophyllum fasciatum]
MTTATTATLEEIPYEKKAVKPSPADSLSDEKKSLPDVERVREVTGDEDGDSLATKGDDDDPAYNVLPQIASYDRIYDSITNVPLSFYLISAIFTALGAWLTQMGFFRTTYIPYS